MPVPAALSRVVATAGVGRALVEYMDPTGVRCRPLATSSQIRFETRSHVAFESWRGRDHLIALDFDPRVIAVAFRPFTLHWHNGDTAGSYIPDYFARRLDGTAVVIDLQSGKQNMTDDGSTVASALCAQLGWSYERALGLDNLHALPRPHPDQV